MLTLLHGLRRFDPMLLSVYYRAIVMVLCLHVIIILCYVCLFMFYVIYVGQWLL